jgi:hypothetical protein
MTFIHNAEKRLLGSTLGLAAAVGAASPILLLFGAVTAHADVSITNFQSPSGNISCSLSSLAPGSYGPGGSTVQCDVGDRTWAAPDCPQNRPAVFMLGTSSAAPTVTCHTVGTLLVPGVPSLDYGQTRSSGPITCDSEPSAMTCTNTSTGHFFRVSRESYQVG